MSRGVNRRSIRLQPAVGRRVINVAEELVDLYAPLVGCRAVSVWLVLRLWAERGQSISHEEPAAAVARALGLTPLEAAQALRQLALYDLLDVGPGGELWVREPLSRHEFERRFGEPTVRRALAAASAAEAADEVAAAGEPPRPVEPSGSVQPPGPVQPPPSPDPNALSPPPGAGGPAEPEATARHARTPPALAGAGAGPEGGRPGASQPPPAEEPGAVPAAAVPQAASLPKDVRSVLDWYHQRIGLISESQFERLCEWITVRGMAADVVALAIEETARSAQYASFSYLEGVLRNWYNHGVRTWEDLGRRRHLSQLLAARAAPAAERPGPSQGPSEPAMSGVPNAEAYRPVDPEQVKRWKEMYAHGG